MDLIVTRVRFADGTEDQRVWEVTWHGRPVSPAARLAEAIYLAELPGRRHDGAWLEFATLGGC